MSGKLKKRLYRILTGLALFAIAMAAGILYPDMNPNIRLVLFLAAYFTAGGDVLKKAVGNMAKGQMLDENFLMAIATVGAFLVGEYPEGVAVMLFYQVGEWFQSYAVNKSRKSISELMDIRPDVANVLRNNEITAVSPEEVRIGETIVVKPGERIPLDGVIIKGSTSLDTMALTGESMPREVAEKEAVISGCVNLAGVVEIRVTKAFGESTVSRILDLVENAGSKKAEAENFITRFAHYYTPCVVAAALLLAIIPPLFGGGAWSQWIYRALTFLVISCPCALVISIPLSFFGGLGGSSKAGILVKGSNYLEALSQTEIVVMDKTGTLTKGSFHVSRIVPEKQDGQEKISGKALLEYTAYAESGSNHPISKSLMAAFGEEIRRERITELEEMAGFGVRAKVDGREVIAGNSRFMEKHKISHDNPECEGTLIHTALDGEYMGYLVIADEIKADAKKAVQGLYAAGVKEVVMLTGDRKAAAEHVADSLGIRKVFYELLPGDKVDRMEELLREKSPGGKLVFVGDGMNDAPVLARADIGIAMGGLGSDAAIEAADVVIMTDEPSKIVRAMEISKKTLRIVRENIVFAIGIKLLVLLLAAVGFASMWAAVFADVGVAVIAILNAMRALKA